MTTETTMSTPIVNVIRHGSFEWVQGEDFEGDLPVEQAFELLKRSPGMSSLAGHTLGKPVDMTTDGVTRRVYPVIKPAMAERQKGATPQEAAPERVAPRRLPWGLDPVPDSSVASFVALLTHMPPAPLRLPLFLALVEQADPDGVIPGGNDIAELGEEAETLTGAVASFVTRLRAQV